jgi:hypothetical protein
MFVPDGQNASKQFVVVNDPPTGTRNGSLNVTLLVVRQSKKGGRPDTLTSRSTWPVLVIVKMKVTGPLSPSVTQLSFVLLSISKLLFNTMRHSTLIGSSVTRAVSFVVTVIPVEAPWPLTVTVFV